ncbi:hypothetical protein CHCC15087_3808 [Bacillus licheniformis]|nr:hypothetical protein CHCC15087_3808 [Bacillus licheniformis]
MEYGQVDSRNREDKQGGDGVVKEIQATEAIQQEGEKSIK